MGLTQAPKEFRETFQAELKSELRKIPGVTVLDFLGLEAGTAVDVYECDRGHTESADLCLFVVDHPSIGLGIEIEIRRATGKGALVFAAEGAKITRMLIGMCEKENIPLIRYLSTVQIALAVRDALSAE